MNAIFKPLMLSLLAGLLLPRAVPAVEPNVTIDSKAKSPSSPDMSCVQIPDSYRTAGPFTVKELEAESLREDPTQQLPFGKANAQWKDFLRQLRKGDTLLMYDEGCCTGIIIVRKECIVDWFPISS